MERTQNETSAAAPRRELPGSWVDWSAVLAGAVIAAASAGIFAAFGAALGLSTISAEPGRGSFSLWMILTAIWVLISLMASYLLGGYVAGRMRRRLDDSEAGEVEIRDGVNGLVVWGLGMLVAGWMAASAFGGAVQAVGTAAGGAAQAVGSAAGGAAQGAGSLVGGAVQGAGSLVGGAVQGAGSAVGGALRSEDGQSAVSYFNDALLRPALEGARQPEALGEPATPALDDSELARQTGVVLGNVLRTGEVSEEDRAFLIAATAQRTNLGEAEVEARVDQAVQKVQETRAEAERLATEAREEAERLATEAQAEARRLAEEAQEAAIQAAESARVGAILTAFLLAAAALAAGAAAVVGGVHGGRHRDERRFFGGLSYRPRA